MKILEDNLAVVTGASRGIGFAIAAELGSQGARVILADIDSEAVEKARKALADQGNEVWAETVDVSARDQTAALAERVTLTHGDISILVNNAGIGGAARLGDSQSQAQWDKAIAVNLTGIFDITTAFLPSLKRTRGSIVNISSIVAFTSGFAQVGYTASKGGVKSLTQAMCRELAPFGIRVNAVAPGYAATAMGSINSQVEEWIKWHCPMGRHATPEEIAGPVAFLVSPAAKFVNGVTLPVDGGYLTI